jgi:hypothetical protein
LNNASSIRERISPYVASRWLVVYGYLAVLLIATPNLPLVINWARERWQSGSVDGFVLGVEIAIGIALIALAGSIFFLNRGKFLRCILVICALIGASGLFFFLNPNPYELTHLPEYAVLSILIMGAMREKEAKAGGNVNGAAFYIRAAVITVALGAVDELYQGALPLRFFNAYDILLNGAGGILGLTVFWGVERG